MSDKINVVIGQRISRLRKSRRKWDFSPLYRSASFFSMRGNLKMRHLCSNLILSAPLFPITSHGKREPTGDKVHSIRVTIFLGMSFFYYSKQSKHVFSLWITTNLFQQHMQTNELCAVWVMSKWLRNHWNCSQHVYLSHFQQTGKVAFLTLY